MNPAASLSSNPKIQFLHTRFQQAVSLALEKAARHLQQPAQYPLPPAGKKSLESALVNFLKLLSDRKQEKFIGRMHDALNANTAKRQQLYGDLAAIDLKKNTAIAEQVKNLPVADAHKISEAEMESLFQQAFPGRNLFRPGEVGKKIVPRQATVATKLDFIVDSLTCVKPNDLHKDEISLGAVATDAFGNNLEKEPFFVSKFKKGESAQLGANGNLFSFTIDDGSVGGSFPATFVAGLFLIEADLIHNEKLGFALTAIFTAMAPLLITIGMVLLFVPGGPAVAFWLFVGAAVFGILGHYVFPLITDDFSLTVTDTLVLDAPPAVGETFSRTISLHIDPSFFKGFAENRGNYTASVRWVAA